MRAEQQSLLERIAGLEAHISETARCIEALRQQLAAETTSRERVEETLQHFQTVVERCPAAVVITNVKGEIEYVNRRFELVSGYQFEEVKGKNPRILKSGETSPQEYRELWQTILAGKEWTGEFHNRRKNGEIFVEHAGISPIRNRHGEISHFLAVKEDISQHKVRERELEESRLIHMHQAKMAEFGLLSAGILHEVGNPIASIQGLVNEIQVLHSDKSLPELSSYTCDRMGLIMEHIHRLLNITREISDFMSPRPGEQELLDLNGLIHNTCRLLGYDKRWHAIEVRLELDSQLPALKGIRDQLSHVILNLLANAADAVLEPPREHPTIVINTCSSGDRIILTIRDNGHGMNEHTLRHACDSFFTTKPSGKGTGLGLAVCQSIISASNGTLTIDSNPDGGTSILVNLPLEQHTANGDD